MISVHRVNGTNLLKIIHGKRQNGKRTRATESVIRNNANSFPYITQTWWMALAAMRCEATHGVCRRRGVIGTPACQGWRIAPKVYTISRSPSSPSCTTFIQRVPPGNQLAMAKLRTQHSGHLRMIGIYHCSSGVRRVNQFIAQPLPTVSVNQKNKEKRQISACNTMHITRNRRFIRRW